MKRWQFWFGILVSVILLYFIVLPKQNISQLWDSLRNANYIWLIPGISVYFIGVWVRAWRLHYMMRHNKEVSVPKLFAIVCIGYMGNNIYPARAGEFLLRPYILKQKEGIAMSFSLAVVLIERIFDAVVMMLFIFVNLPEIASLKSDSGVAGTIQELAIFGTVIFFGALLIFLLAAMFPKITARTVEWSIHHFPFSRYQAQLQVTADRFLEGLRCLRSPRDAIMIFLTSIFIWLLETSKYWFLMHGFGFTVSFFTLMLMNGIANLVTTIPSAPGYVGTFEAAGIAVLTAYGVKIAVATAYTVVLHAALWLPITIIGAGFMFHYGLSLTNVPKKIQSSGSI